MQILRVTAFVASLAWVAAQPFAGGVYKRQNETDHPWTAWDKSSSSATWRSSSSSSSARAAMASNLAVATTTVSLPTTLSTSASTVASTVAANSNSGPSTSLVASIASDAGSVGVLVANMTTTSSSVGQPSTVLTREISSTTSSSSGASTTTQESMPSPWNRTSSRTSVLAANTIAGIGRVANSTTALTTTTSEITAISTYAETRTITSGVGDSTTVVTTTLHLTSTIMRTVTITVPAARTTNPTTLNIQAAEPTTTMESTSTFWVTVTVLPVTPSAIIVNGGNVFPNTNVDTSATARPAETGGDRNETPTRAPSSSAGSVSDGNLIKPSGLGVAAVPTSFNNDSRNSQSVRQDTCGCDVSVVTTTVVIHTTVTVTPALPVLPTAVQPFYPMGNGTHLSRGTASSGFLTIRTTSRSSAPLTTGSS